MSVPDRLAAALADRYRLERELGAGGMATVYLALDLKHNRQVAVKVLRPDLAATLGPDRFVREIEIAARLQHPHILPVHDSGESGGFLYYVMPYVEGESLRQRLSARGELPIHDAVRLLLEIADALAYAHGHGVVHRDIKPENIMLSGRHALVMDFGVAKAVSEATGRTRLTTAGVALGTPTYMAPEQASADPNLDQRVDVYALGVMGYELLSGQPPFTGGTPQQVLAAHVTTLPEPVTARRPTVPPALASVIMRALEKRAADRWQTAEEMHAALEPFATPSQGITPTQTEPIRAYRHPGRRGLGIAATVVIGAALAWWRIGTGPGGTPDAQAIAVLPFDNASRDTTYDYLADGLANDVREGLMQLPGLTVKARTSSAAARGKPVREAGRLLDVPVLLQGEYRHTPGRVTVTVDLVKVSDESALWTHNFTLPPDGNFAAAQDSITAAVAAALHLTTTAGAENAAARRGTSDLVAYDLYLKGEFFFAERGADNLFRAIDYFRKAIERDPGFARAYAGLSATESILPWYAHVATDSIVRHAAAMARRALAIDSTLAEAHLALGSALGAEFRPDLAELEFRAAVALDPRNATAHQWHGVNLTVLGRLDEAIREHQIAVRLDPLSAVASADLAYAYLCSGRYADAIGASRRTLELDSTMVYGRQYLGEAQAFSGQRDSAIATFDRMFRTDSTSPFTRLFRVWRFALEARWPEAERETVTIERTAPTELRDPELTAAYLVLGRLEPALDAMERAVRARSFYLAAGSLGCDPAFAPLRTEPRFVALMKESGREICGNTVKWPIPPRPGRMSS